MTGADPTGAAPTRGAATVALVAHLALVALLALAMVAPGCRLGPRDFRNENDRLRRENLELQRQVEGLEQRLELRVGELESLRQRLDRVDGEPIESMPDAEPPTLSRLRFGRYSGGFDTTDDGVHDRLRIYLRPVDQRGRVMPVAGRAVVQAVALAAEDEPRILARRTYTPGEFDRAWRSGVAGTHYTLELELPPDEVPQAVTDVTVRVTFTEARTGVELHHQQTFRVRRG